MTQIIRWDIACVEATAEVLGRCCIEGSQALLVVLGSSGGETANRLASETMEFRHEQIASGTVVLTASIASGCPTWTTGRWAPPGSAGVSPCFYREARFNSRRYSFSRFLSTVSSKVRVT